MTASAAGPLQPVFLDGPQGPLFAVYRPPRPGTPDRGDLVYVPPFAEEMNRSRRMVSLQAGALADIGVGVLALDLYGTGDSGGDFGDARWQTWLDDIGAAMDWLEQRGRRRIGLWGLRLGAVLAMQSATADPSRVSRVLLWQPVVSGEVMLTQFLRIRVAAAMGEGQGGETTRTLRGRIATGDTLEVAGYALAPELASAIDAATLAEAPPPGGMPVDWLDVVPTPDNPPPAAGRKVVEAWRQKGGRVSTTVVTGEPFWSLQEVTLAPDLIAATSRLFEEATP